MGRIFDDPANSAFLHRDLRHPLPVVDRAEGVFVWDREGRRYFDGTGGAFVVTIGHGVPEILDAMRRQFEVACYVGATNWATDAAIDLAERIAGLAPDGLEKVIFAAGGSEANEVALKLARQYFMERGQSSKWKLLCRRGGYHGNTIATLSMSGREGWKTYYAPYMLAFEAIPNNVPYTCEFCQVDGGCHLQCLDDLERAILAQGPDTVAAFIAEPVVSRGAMPPAAYWQRIREVCDRYDVLLIADEVITGFGRTGRQFGMDHFGVVPDIITCGKGLASGYASISAVIAHERIAHAIASGSGVHSHGYTFSGNPLACATALSVIDYVAERDLVEQSRVRGAQLFERVQRLRAIPGVADVRGGYGLLSAIEFVDDPGERVSATALATAVRQQAADRGVALYHLPTAGLTTLAIAPPFVITEQQLDEMMDRIDEAMVAVSDRPAATVG
jgi:adenosylmethionine-8-amino-7-oxononanoate aminotransferase